MFMTKICSSPMSKGIDHSWFGRESGQIKCVWEHFSLSFTVNQAECKKLTGLRNFAIEYTAFLKV